MAILKCKMCGGDIELSQDKTFGTCDSCGSTMTFPKVDDEQRANMFNRGNHFRRMGEFDKALAVYERIVQEDENDAEAHWCCALCRFGIEYVEDPNTFEYLPTCHRASFDSFLEDVDYLAALEHSDGVTRRQYQKDAQKIAEVQRGILATSQNEQPFDVFICYKESENDNSRTRDSLLAQDIYYQLTEQGRRVFFSRITLEDKAGTEYEPYIFAALNSAKVMIVVTTSAEHVNAVWVKNEWSRFLSLMRKDRSKLLLPCYRDMDPYDLPEALSVLQSYDMGKIGFIQDLIRGVNKVLDAEKPKESVKETIVVQQQTNANAAPLLKRAFIFLEDGDFSRADEFCEQVLNIDPENAEAYLGKLMAELNVRSRESLKDQPQTFETHNNYQKAMRFGNDSIKKELSDITTYIMDRNETARQEAIYQKAIHAMDAAQSEFEYLEVSSMFRSIISYKDSAEQTESCKKLAENAKIKAEKRRREYCYTAAINTMKTANGAMHPIPIYRQAITSFIASNGWSDADQQIEICKQRIQEQEKMDEEQRLESERLAQLEAQKAKKKRIITTIVSIAAVAAITFIIVLFKVIIPNNKYDAAIALMNEGNYADAKEAFAELNGHKDSVSQMVACDLAIAEKMVGNKEYENAIALIKSIEINDSTDPSTAFEQIKSLYRSIGDSYLSSGDQIHAAICYTRAGDPLYAKSIYDFSSRIRVGKYTTAAITNEGELLFKTNNEDVKDSTKLKGAVSFLSDNHSGSGHLYAIDNSGRLLYLNADSSWGNSIDAAVKSWKGIVSIVYNGWDNYYALMSNGTIRSSIGDKDYAISAVSNWSNIKAIRQGYDCLFGLSNDGNVFTAYRDNYDGKYRCYTASWYGIESIEYSGGYLFGITKEHKIKVTGYSYSETIDSAIEQFTDVVKVYVYDGSNYSDSIIVLHSDGTITAHPLGDKIDNTLLNAISSWNGIINMQVTEVGLIAYRYDGSLFYYEESYKKSQSAIKEWKDVIYVDALEEHHYYYRSPYTNSEGKTEYYEHDSGYDYYAAGLKEDGTLITTGGGIYYISTGITSRTQKFLGDYVKLDELRTNGIYHQVDSWKLW